MSKPFCAFPDGFLWGVATAAYQIEGAAAEEGRTPSVWDTFCKRPGAIAMDHTGNLACDHYHRYKSDVQLMKGLGLKAYRFSFSWSRILPTIDGPPNQRGLDFYSRLIDELLNAGIEPWGTLFHWDLPQWAEDAYRGWESKETSRKFGEMAELVGKQFGNRLAGLFTTNELFCFIDKGFGIDNELFAPGKPMCRKTMNQARHNAIYGHGLAVQAFRATMNGNCPPVGIAENMPGVVPVRETAENINCAREAVRYLAGMYLTPIMEGAYHPDYLTEQAENAPKFTDEEMRVIGTRLDFVGLNIYTPTYVQVDPDSPKGWSTIPHDACYPRMQMPWLALGPAILYWGPRLVSEIWKAPAVYITENGCANDDRLVKEDTINDTARMMYLQNHLVQAHRAVAEGYPLKGYFLWSLMDNFEWAMGYTRRFGICYTNYETMERTPKLSAKFYSDVIARNAVGGLVPSAI